MKLQSLFAAFAASSALVCGPVFAEDGAAAQALLKALPNAKVTLQKGLQAATASGKPISGKFEMEDGKLQLSVYTAKAGKYAEVIVDYSSGKVKKVEPITQGDDLAHAKAQSDALAKAKSSLKTVADRLEHDTPGACVVSITPAVSENKVVANVELAQGGEIKAVVAPVN